MIRIKDKEVQEFEKEHIAAVRDIASECVVLLKSDGVLPLTQAGKIAVYGNGVRRTVKGGTGSGDVNVRHFVTIEEGLTNAGFEITSGEWLDYYDTVIAEARKIFIEDIRKQAKETGVNPVMLGMGRVVPEPDYEMLLDGEGDTAVYVLARNSGEGSDRRVQGGDISLTETEKRDILHLNEKYDKFILVLNVGGMVDLAPVAEVKNILLLSQLGTSTGDVLADILLGKSYPSGKLTMTWAPITAYPSTEGFADPDNTYYKEGIYVGYRYFDTVGIVPAYPFGYGLGYTTFQIEPLAFRADEKKISVTVRVKNTGNFAGKEVVQVYYSAPKGKLDKPYQELGGFVKTKELKPQEETEVIVVFDTVSMASYDTSQAAYVMEKGEYILRAGNCSGNTNICGIVFVDRDVVTAQVRNICQGWGFEDYKPLENVISEERDEEEKKAADVIVLKAEKIDKVKVEYENKPVELPQSDSSNLDAVREGTKTLDEFVGSLTEEQLAYMCIGSYEEELNQISIIGSTSKSVAGAAGETTQRLKHLGVDSLVMADGPAGLRLSSRYKVVDGQVKASSNTLGEDFVQFMEPENLQSTADIIPEIHREEVEDQEYYQYCIAIPIGTALAQSWNLDVCKRCGGVVGKEMQMFGIHLWLAPALNIQRSPLCGRNFEYYSEDPLVSGMIAAAVTEGVQQYQGCGTTIKHFACNNQETNRYGSNSVVSERALREIYLRGFEICVRRSQPHAVMSSYNLINGEHACSSKDIQTLVLRDEWGYEGIVMTDWYVTAVMGEQGSGKKDKHDKAYAAGCVKAGNDITMPGTHSDKEDILKALTDGGHMYSLTKAELQVCAKRVLESILKVNC